jgi:CheY-like chemotaxis protein
MIMTTSALPVALVVEDKPASRERRVKLLETSGFIVFSAASSQGALQEVRSVPSIDIVVTDINLDPESATDKSGLALARSIRSENLSMPIIGYSAWFSEGELGSIELKVFDDYLPKGASTPDELLARVERWRGKALGHRKERATWAAAELERLRQKYGTPHPNFTTLRLLELDSGHKTSSDEPSAEDILRRSGYRLRIIEPGTSRPLLNDAEAKIISPLVVWLKQESDITIAEIYGYPALYGFGDNEEQALTQVLLLMRGFYQELVVEAPTDEALSVVTRRLRDFLKHVFG